jgi:uncharacterized protein (DUF2141 family)
MSKLLSISILVLLSLAMIAPVFALTGDVNGDGKVDIQDIAIVSFAFGSYVGSSRWNPLADLDGDGKVDIRDMATVAANFGKHI